MASTVVRIPLFISYEDRRTEFSPIVSIRIPSIGVMVFLLETVLIVGTSPSSSAGFEKITFMVVPFRRTVPVFGFGLSKKFLENGRKEKNKGFSRSSSRGCENCGE